MSKKKNCVKKGSEQAKTYLRQAAERVEDKKMTLYREAMQASADIASLVLNQEFGFGPERLKRFADGFIRMHHEVRVLDREDQDDKDAWYSVQMFEDAMKRAWGEYYQPREVRFSDD